MEYAYDPKACRSLNVDQYKDLYGPKRDQNGEPRYRPVLKCLACDTTLHTVAEDSAAAVRTWGHDPSPGVYCPIKSSGKESYELLAPREVDVARGVELRASFFRNWALHWGYVRDIAPLADVLTFIGFLREADRTKFWQQRHLEEWHLHYVFLSTCEFPPPKGAAAAYRPEWLRFRFDGRYRVLEDLWIRAGTNFRFLRLKYRAPLRKKSPGPADFIVAEPIAVDSAWMTRTFAPPNLFAIDRMTKAFPRELAGGSI